MKKLTCISLLLLVIAITLNAQRSPQKYGKIEIEDLQSNVCPIDSNAHAYFIFDYGISQFIYPQTKIDVNGVNNKGYQLQYTRHYRIKVCDKLALEWGDVKFSLFGRNSNEEKLSGFKACVYNLENGKVEKTKFDRGELISEESSKNWTTIKAALPNVKEGSVLEVEYTITSDFYFNLREWNFQYYIPVLQSDYHVFIPEYFNYNHTQKGYYPIHVDQSAKSEKLTLTFEQKAEGVSQRGYSYTQDFDYRVDIYNYEGKNIPAFPKEKYLRTATNYLSCIAFELRSVNFPNSPMKLYTTSWEEINRDLLKDYNFGLELGKSGHLKNAVEQLQSQGDTGLGLVEKAFGYIKENMTWNQYNRVYTSKGLGATFKDGTGSCADINLNLVALLQRLGFNADPVVLSTQTNGIIYPVHPSISSFNYVIAQVKIDGNIYLLDATDPLSEINLLPVRCLNDKGFVVSQLGGSWVNLMDYKPYRLQEMTKVKFRDDFSFEGQSSLSLFDYAAYDMKNRIKKFDSLDKFRESLEEEDESLEIEEITVSGMDEGNGRFTVKYPFVQNNRISTADDMVYFCPVIGPFISSNPFKLEERHYPVEFDYPYSVRQIYSYEVPQDYQVEELPKPFAITLPDNKAIYKYNIVKNENVVNLVLTLIIQKSMFLPDEYGQLKQLYQTIVDKQKELVVLKHI